MLQTMTVFFLFLLPMGLFAQDTELKFYRPFADPNLQTQLVIRKQIQGECWQQSQRIKREDAWRCVTFPNKSIHDPCFIKADSLQQQALCFSSPWVHDGVQINLLTPVSNKQHVTLNMAETYPWAVELMTGEKCIASDGTRFHGDLPERYQCDNSTILFGHLQRCKAMWSILQSREQRVVRAQVAKAWF